MKSVARWLETCRCQIGQLVGAGSSGYIVKMAKRKPSDDDLTICGGDDFLVKQGIADPDEFRVKSHLCHVIQTIAEERSLTAADLASLAGGPDEEAAAVLRSRHSGVQVWRLIKMLSALGADIGIYVMPGGGHDRGIVLSETIDETKERTVKSTAELADEEVRLIRSARTPPEHDYDYTDTPERDCKSAIAAGPEAFPESAIVRVREIAESHPAIDVEIAGGLLSELK